MTFGPLEHVTGMSDDLAFRNDLSDAIAVFVPRPMSFEATQELLQYLETISETIDTENPQVPSFERTVPVHPYEIPPAAGTWSEFAILLWEHGRPILENVSMIAGAAEGIRLTMKLATNWGEHRNQQAAERRDRSQPPISPPAPDPSQSLFLSQGAIGVLVLADFVERHGYQPDLTMKTVPRGLQGYNDPAHPNGEITYLIECKWAENKTLVYVVDSRANVIEHFKVTDGSCHPLPIPDLLKREDFIAASEPGDHGLDIHFGSK
jgi:hypothetical protein